MATQPKGCFGFLDAVDDDCDFVFAGMVLACGHVGKGVLARQGVLAGFVGVLGDLENLLADLTAGLGKEH